MRDGGPEQAKSARDLPDVAQIADPIHQRLMRHREAVCVRRIKDAMERE
jgi:hypothetical protein